MWVDFFAYGFTFYYFFTTSRSVTDFDRYYHFVSYSRIDGFGVSDYFDFVCTTDVFTCWNKHCVNFTRDFFLSNCDYFDFVYDSYHLDFFLIYC